jgi:hypothetical protein
MGSSVKAEHGNIIDGDYEWSDLDDCRAHARELLLACDEAEIQRVAIAAACADGHDWGGGINCQCNGVKYTFSICLRDGCEADMREDGWLPFEPKTHDGYVDWEHKPVVVECTGPGCDACMYEAAANLPPISITRGGIQFPTPPAIVDAFDEAQK